MSTDAKPKKRRTIKSLLPYFGGKRTLAPRIVAELGAHQAYWEPFAGSLSVVLAKEPCGHEYINDAYGDVVNLGRVLASQRWGVLQDRLQRTLCSEDFFREANRVCYMTTHEVPEEYPNWPTDEDVERAYWFIIFSWLGMNGFVGSNSKTTFSLRFTTTGGAQSRRFRSLVDALADFHERLRFVSITRRCGIKLCEKIDDAPEVCVYADPPYLLDTRSKGGNRYIHEFSAEQHEQLAAALCRFKKTRVVVSYYDSPNLDRLYPGWTVVRIDVNKQMAMHSHRGSKPKPVTEVLLINGPSYVTGQGELF